MRQARGTERPKPDIQQMEATSGAIHPMVLCNLIREQPDRFLHPEEAQRLCKLLPRVQGGDVYAYGALTNELAKLQMPRECVQLLIKMDAERIDITTRVFNNVVNAYVKKGAEEGLDDLIGIMKSRGAMPDTYTYTMLIQHFAAQGNLDRCQLLMQDMTDRKTPMDNHIVTALVECFFRAGKPEHALRVPEVMRASYGLQPSVSVMNVIIKCLIKHGQTDEALRVYADMTGQHGIQPDKYTCTPLMHALIACGQPDKAIELFDAVRRSGAEPCVQNYTLLVDAHSARGDARKAAALLDEMTSEGVRPDDRLYYRYVKAFLTGGHFRELVGVCARMDRLGMRMDRQTVMWMVRYLDRVDVESVKADVESLLALVQVIHKHNTSYRATTFLEPFLDKCRQEKRLEEAVQFMERVHAAGGPQLHRAYLFSFSSMGVAHNNNKAHKTIQRLHSEGLFK